MIYRYFFQIKTFLVLDKIFEKLNYSTAFFSVLFLSKVFYRVLPTLCVDMATRICVDSVLPKLLLHINNIALELLREGK